VTALPKGLAGLFGPDHPFKPEKLGDMFARWRRARAAGATAPKPSPLAEEIAA